MVFAIIELANFHLNALDGDLNITHFENLVFIGKHRHILLEWLLQDAIGKHDAVGDHLHGRHHVSTGRNFDCGRLFEVGFELNIGTVRTVSKRWHGFDRDVIQFPLLNRLDGGFEWAAGDAQIADDQRRVRLIGDSNRFGGNLLQVFDRRKGCHHGIH